MKLSFSFITACFLSFSFVNAQNALLDGINNNKTERTDNTGDIYSKFKGIEKDACTFELHMERYENFELDYEIYNQVYTWSWKDITFIKSGDQLLEMSGKYNSITLSSEEQSSKKATTTQRSSVKIYFGSADAMK